MDAESPGARTRAETLLDESVGLLAPLVQLLVASGVTYPQFTAALKTAFLRAAHAELEKGPRKVTDSAVSLLSGVHRKDVRALTSDGVLKAHTFDRMLSLPDEVFTRWTNDPNYLDADGFPKVLPMRGRTPEEPSFEQLSQSISRDFHPRSIVEELVRLGMAEVQGETVRLRAGTYVPREDFAKTLSYIRANVADHIASAAQNLRAVQQGDVRTLPGTEPVCRRALGGIGAGTAAAGAPHLGVGAAPHVCPGERTHPHRRARFARNAADADALRCLLLFGTRQSPF